LGVYILENINFPKFNSARFEPPFIWKLCGPTHDLGYPVEIAHAIRAPFADEVNNILDSINSPSPKVVPDLYMPGLDKLCDNRNANDIIQNRLADWGIGIDIKEYYSWLRQKNRTDHGVVSALVQLKLIDAMYFYANPQKEYKDIKKNGLNYNQKNFDLDIVSACSALFIHNIDRNYSGFSNKISFNIAPLAFLLYLCDTFQEWDRYSDNRPVYSGHDFGIDCDKDSISLFVPDTLEDKIIGALYQRLTDLRVTVNGRIAVC
ncbi:hypothetical protein MNBD_CPR01-98, partial [hydrothermal vent metagenome]